MLGSKLVIVFSALLAYLSFLIPAYCAELIFLSVSTLFFRSCFAPTFLTFFGGFLWGMVFNGCYFIALFYCMVDHSPLHWFILIALYSFFISYCSLFSACWFLVWSLLIHFCSKNPYRLILINLSGIISTFLYCFAIENYLLIIFGYQRGNSLQNFLVPLAIRSFWLRLFSFFSLWVLLFLFIIFSAINAVLFFRRAFFLLFCIWFSLLTISSLIDLPSDIPDWVDSIICIPPVSADALPRKLAHLYSDIFINLCLQYPQAKWLVLPESSFPFPLNKYPDLVQVLTDQLPASMNIIIGSHFEYRDGRVTNCCYSLNSGRIIYHYEKKIYLVFTEFVPSFFRRFAFLHNLFLKDKIHFDPLRSSFEAPPRERRGFPSCAPMICADLFLEGGALAQAPQSVIMALVNDSWFSCCYAKNLMLLSARLKSVLFHKHIIYISHEFASLLIPNGKELRLNFSRR